MKSVHCTTVVLFAFACLFTSCKDNKPPRKSKYDNMANLMAREFRIAKDPHLNTVPTERLLEAQRVRDEILEVAETMKSPVPGITWQERGANNVGGRTRVLWFDLNDDENGYKKVWAAGVGGGLWYTNDITVSSPTWIKVDDLLQNMAISAFVQSRSNPQIMYFGTGEGWFNSDAMQGAGIWKSVNGGLTWNRLASTETFYYVQDLIIDNNDHLYAAVRFNNLGIGARGIQKTTNGGTTWTQVLTSPFASSDRGGDLELASNGDIYASMGTLSSNGGVYRSSSALHGANTGNSGTWLNITPSPTNVIGTPTNWWHRIELACAPSNANIVYALFQGYGNMNCTAIKQYDASSNTWLERDVPEIIDQGSNSNFTRGQAFYDLIAAVDPNNAASLYIGGIDALRSVDSAKTWVQMTTWSLFAAGGFTSNQLVHADHHAITFAPGSSATAAWGTDGGIYYTTNANVSSGKPTFRSKNVGYNVTQYYSVATHPSNANYFLAGAQDNGTHKFTTAGLGATTEVSGGDGGFCFIDSDNPSIQISSYVFNNYHVSTNGGASFASYPLNNRGDFINAAGYESSTNTLYAGDDAGYYFRWTNPQDAGAGTDIETQVSVPAFGDGLVSHVATSPSTAGKVFFGLSNGSVVLVTDATNGAAKTGTVIRTGTGNVSCVAIDPSNEDHIVVTYSNYGVTNIFETYNASAATPTWTAIEGNLPDMPVRWAQFDPRNSDWMLLATELGVWSTNNINGAATEWTVTNNGMANVRVDMLRYSESSRTIAAATHGRGLFTALIPTATTPDINFSTGTLVITEESAVTADCRGYRDYTINMTIANPPTGTATVTLGVQPGSALAGVDYDVTTNGSFTSPSNTVSFASGATLPKVVTLRVYDDVDDEATENITFNYTITGSTNAQPGTGAQTVVISIADNDSAPTAFATNNHAIGSIQYQLGTSTSPQLFDSRLIGKKSVFLYKASELTAGGLTAGNIASIAFLIEQHSTRPYQNLQIRMGATALNYLVDGMANVPATALVKTVTSFNTVDGWNTLVLDAPFSWNGTDNIAVQVCYTNSAADAGQTVDRVFGYLDPVSTTQRNMFWQDVSCATSFGTVGIFNGDFKPHVQFGKTVNGTAVATAISSQSHYLNRTSDLYLYNGGGEILARVRNTSGSHNYGCTDFEIDRAGTGATQFWNTAPANRLMNKTFYIAPTTNNASGTYEITLYFTAAEVAGWETATGQSFNNIKLIKTSGRISDVTPAQPDGAGAVSIVDPVIGTLGTNRTLTYTFSNGFSGFGAGIPGNSTLPVTLLEFGASLQNKVVNVVWKTTAESNLKGFDIQRSSDGVSYQKIGHVPASGNGSYRFIDKDPLLNLSYYRLKQIDLDLKHEYSRVVTVVNNSRTKPVLILQNPVRDKIELMIGDNISGRAEFQLLNMTGQVITKWSSNATAGQKLSLVLSDRNVAAGVYVLRMKLNGTEFVHRIIKE